jgi:endonuclease/exonuclease/phosphatase (EEP) superfamily protein YafD
MAAFLFWNTAKKKIAREIALACRENAVDVLVLAENASSEAELLLALNANKPALAATYVSPFNPSAKLKFITGYPPDRMIPIFDEGGVSARLIRPPVGIEILLIAVHLPSKLHMTPNEQTVNAIRVADLIRKAEKSSGSNNSILLGDFNMDPFEDGMVTADGIHAVMDRRIARRLGRTVQGQHRDFFYNPMWSKLGDESEGPPGTFYYYGGQISRFWHTFDQVLLRPSLLEYYSTSGVKVLTSIGSRDLLREDRIDRQISDHLPLLVQLQTERGVKNK